MEQQGERLSADIDFPKVLFLHINRVLQAPTDEAYVVTVDRLDDALCPYLDNEYWEDLKVPDLELKNMMVLDGSTQGKDSMIAMRKIMMARERFRALMKLAHRKNLLIQRTDRDEVWELEEEEENAAETETNP